ncbi:MAG: hypothetical protein ACI9UK_000867, partial [Candidatus Krumholzibacteriia bacterium]
PKEKKAVSAPEKEAERTSITNKRMISNTLQLRRRTRAQSLVKADVKPKHRLEQGMPAFETAAFLANDGQESHFSDRQTQFIYQ